MSTPLDPQVEAVLAADPPALKAPTLAEQRAGYAGVAERLGGEPEPVAEILDLQAAGVPARAYRPATALDADAVPVIVWFHGGGWVIGDLDGIDRVCRALANGADAVVLSVDYRLAPEHPFPAAVEDADGVVAWLTRGDGPATLGTDPARVAVGGDSAGGNLAAVAALHARADVVAQLLVYPVVDGTRERRSWAEHAADPILTAAQMRAFWEHYLDDHPREDADASPIHADLAGAPPALVAVAGYDVLHDEGLAYAEALRAGGVEVELLRYDDMPHGFLRWGGVVERARELTAELAGFVRQMTGDPSA